MEKKNKKPKMPITICVNYRHVLRSRDSPFFTELFFFFSFLSFLSSQQHPCFGFIFQLVSGNDETYVNERHGVSIEWKNGKFFQYENRLIFLRSDLQRLMAGRINREIRETFVALLLFVFRDHIVAAID